MKTKNDSVECRFHHVITSFLFKVDRLYNFWEDECVITSGSESSANHSYTSFHYADPGQAADIRIWDELANGRGKVPCPREQFEAAKELRDVYCKDRNIPHNWIDIVLESDHIHIEYQPKRLRRK